MTEKPAISRESAILLMLDAISDLDLRRTGDQLLMLNNIVNVIVRIAESSMSSGYQTGAYDAYDKVDAWLVENDKVDSETWVGIIAEMARTKSKNS